MSDSTYDQHHISTLLQIKDQPASELRSDMNEIKYTIQPPVSGGNNTTKLSNNHDMETDIDRDDNKQQQHSLPVPAFPHSTTTQSTNYTLTPPNMQLQQQYNTNNLSQHNNTIPALPGLESATQPSEYSQVMSAAHASNSPSNTLLYQQIDSVHNNHSQQNDSTMSNVDKKEKRRYNGPKTRRPPIHFSVEQKKLLRELRDGVLHITHKKLHREKHSELAEQFNVPQGSIRAWFKKHQTSETDVSKSNKMHFTPAQKDKMLNAIRSGISHRAHDKDKRALLSREIGIPEQSLYRWIEKHQNRRLKMEESLDAQRAVDAIRTKQDPNYQSRVYHNHTDITYNTNTDATQPIPALPDITQTTLNAAANVPKSQQLSNITNSTTSSSSSSEMVDTKPVMIYDQHGNLLPVEFEHKPKPKPRQKRDKNAPLTRKATTKFSSAQRERLETARNVEGITPRATHVPQRQALASELNLDPAIVNRWFDKHRLRRDEKLNIIYVRASKYKKTVVDPASLSDIAKTNIT